MGNTYQNFDGYHFDGNFPRTLPSTMSKALQYLQNAVKKKNICSTE